ncbi:MAG: prepilin peptidase [Coriobacteriales bacterium]|nr:prepilin peptidase [Coriobacteriales bacterium]
MALNITTYAIVFIFGTVIASFLNVLIYRIPQKLDFVRGRSLCPNCEHRLGPLDLIPIVSYLALGRKCRYCHKPISPRYMIIEFIGGILALCSWTAFQYNSPLLHANETFFGTTAPILAPILYFAVLCILLVVTCIDAETMEIPDGLNIALLICGVAAIFIAPEVTILSRIIGLFCVSVPLLVITLIVPGAFGGGDVKLMAAAGFLLGWQSTLVAIFIGVLIGGAWGIYLMASGKKGAKGHFAFGPALCVGIAIALFFGAHLVTWYLGFL